MYGNMQIKGDNMTVYINILHEEFKPNTTYKGVKIGDKVFYSGDVVKDWEDGMRNHWESSDDTLLCMSSFDDFLMDSGKYGWDDDTFLITHLTNK